MNTLFLKLQKELNELDKRLYPGNDTVLMTLGVVEECGELLENIQKNGQDYNIDDIKDSVADIIVFAVQIASFEGIDFYVNLDNYVIDLSDNDATEDLMVVVGKLCHHILKRKQGLGKKEDHFEAIKKQLANIAFNVERIAERFEFDWREAFVDVVEKDVLKRERKGREQRYIESKGQ